MGAINHGNQNISWIFHEELSALDFNKRSVDIIPRGIYKGGHLRISESKVVLTPFSLEVGDDNIQISCKSSEDAILSGNLDSGTISSVTPYLVFRWTYEKGQPNNYVEVHAVKLSDIETNDIIIGKCGDFVGGLPTTFSYTERTFLNVQDIFLKVEPPETTEMYVWVRAGRIQISSKYILVPEQKIGISTPPSGLNSRIDLVYVDIDGTVKVQPGTADASPSVPDYGGKLVLAQVKVISGDTHIPSERITDVRSFITKFGGFQIRSGNTKDFAKGVNWTLVENAWTDLDLSSIVPIGTRAVFLRVHCTGTLASVWCRFRSKDETYSGWLIESSIVNRYADSVTGTAEDIIVGCGSSNRRIQYFIPSGQASKFVDLSFRVAGIFF